MAQAKPKSNDKRSSESRRRDLAKIHIAKKQLGMDDITYREMLFDITGFHSSADLDDKQRWAVIKHLKTKGFYSKHKTSKASGMHRTTAPDRSPLLSKIGAILADLKLPWAYADGMAKRMFKVDKVRWLKPDQLHKVAAALIYYQKRVYTENRWQKN